jgi:hypothetical protein
METTTDPLRGAWRILVLLWFVAVLNYLDRIMITTMRVSLVCSERRFLESTTFQCSSGQTWRRPSERSD